MRRALQDDFVDFGDMEERRQAELEEHEDYYKLTDIVIKNKEETKMMKRDINDQTKDIQNARQRLKHVTNRCAPRRRRRRGFGGSRARA